MNQSTATSHFQSLLADDVALVPALGKALRLDAAVRYKLGLIRTSLRDKEVLARQAETGINVFAHLPDFQALAERANLDSDPEWVTVRYCDLVPGAGRGVVGCLGLLGHTVFLAIHDSAIASTLPPWPGDPAGVGRSAFTELAISCALAAQISDFYAPTRSRWWRNDHHGHRLLEALMRNLPGLTIWEGHRPLDVSASGSVSVSVEGSLSSSAAAGNKETAMEKALNDLRDGRWPRASHELPLGLRRKPTAGRSLSREVEPHPAEAVAVGELLRLLAAGDSYAAIGRKAAELKVAVPGPDGHTTTFADVPDVELSAKARALFTDAALSYWEEGSWVFRLHTSLPVDEVGGQNLSYDEETRKRYKDTVLDKFPYPDDAFGVDESQWKLIHDRRRKEVDKRTRQKGAAAARAGSTSAFSGVSRWTAESPSAASAEPLDADSAAAPRSGGSQEGGCSATEFLFAPETSTAYRIRVRAPEERGAGRREGTCVATLRKVVFDRHAGAALLARLEDLTDPLAPEALSVIVDPLAELRTSIAELERQVEDAEAAAERWDDAFEKADDPDEQVHAQNRARKRRDQARAGRRRLTDLRSDLAVQTEQAKADDKEHTVDAELTLPVLVADALLLSDGSVPAEVREGLAQMGVLDSMRYVADASTDPRSWWTFTATATVRLLDGTKMPVPFSWRVQSSLDASGRVGPLLPMLVTAWAAGTDLDTAGTLVGLTGPQADRALRGLLKRTGVAHRGLRAAAARCPIAATRAVIAARALDQPELAEHVPSTWRTHVEAVYWQQGAFRRGEWGSYWCPPNLAEARRVVAELGVAGPSGLDCDAIGRRIGLTTARVRRIIRTHGIATVAGRRARLLPCAADGCNGTVAHYLPTPETGTAGLLCTSCATTTVGVIAPIDYLEHWEAPEGTPAIGRPSSSNGRVRDEERRLTIGEAADLLEINEPAVRALVDAGEIACIRGRGARGGPRLFRERDLRAIPKKTVSAWQARAVSLRDTERLYAAEAAALLGVATHHLRPLLRRGLLTAERDAAGSRTYDPAELRSIPQEILDGLAEGLVGIGEVATCTGYAARTIRTLTKADVIPSVVSLTGNLRYDLVAATEALLATGLDKDDELVMIGTAADMLGVSTGIVRTRSDADELPVFCVVAGTRYYSRKAIEALVSPQHATSE